EGWYTSLSCVYELISASYLVNVSVNKNSAVYRIVPFPPEPRGDTTQGGELCLQSQALVSSHLRYMYFVTFAETGFPSTMNRSRIHKRTIL
ncbi:MAG: hypothetical protein ACK55Z_32230, partial [bacterium]